MYSGIVETIGTIVQIKEALGCKDFTIILKNKIDPVAIGDSIAINGVCLTITNLLDQAYCVTAVPETLRLTNLDQLMVGSFVNIELSLKNNQRIGGHYVQGHVDGKAQIVEIKNDHGPALLVTLRIPSELSKYIVTKGYIAIDGMSITVIDMISNQLTVTLIPHTQHASIAHQYREGHWVNLEVDMMAKYVEKLLGVYPCQTL